MAGGLAVAYVVSQTRTIDLTMELDELDRLRSYWELLDESEDVEEIFPGLEWLDESLIQTLPDETWLATEYAGTLRVASLIIDLSSLLERIHSAGLRVNCLQPNMLIIDERGQLAGLVLPKCITELLAPAGEVPTAQLHCGFAPPELRKFSGGPPGTSTDVFGLASLYHHFITGRPGEDLMRTAFQILSADDAIGPAARRVLTQALIVQPQARTSTPAKFATALNRAVVDDASATELMACAAGLSDIGIGGRTTNEDAFTLSIRCAGGSSGSSVRGALAVADGMGGLRHGDAASRLCIERVEQGAEQILFALGQDDDRAASNRLATDWAHALNSSALEFARELGVEGDFGSTLTAMFVCGPRAIVVHAGDSRLFRLRGDNFERLTDIQSYAARLVEKGELTEVEMEQSIFKNKLVNFVGCQSFQPQVFTLEIQAGDTFLLCSDGPLDGLTRDEIVDVLKSMGADHAVRELMNRAKCALLNRAPDPDSDGQPYSDNLTLIVLQLITHNSVPGADA